MRDITTSLFQGDINRHILSDLSTSIALDDKAQSRLQWHRKRHQNRVVTSRLLKSLRSIISVKKKDNALIFFQHL